MRRKKEKRILLWYFYYQNHPKRDVDSAKQKGEEKNKNWYSYGISTIKITIKGTFILENKRGKKEKLVLLGYFYYQNHPKRDVFWVLLGYYYPPRPHPTRIL